MISRIEQPLMVRQRSYASNNTAQKTTKKTNQLIQNNPKSTYVDPKLLQAYHVSFGGRIGDTVLGLLGSVVSGPEEPASSAVRLEESYTSETTELIRTAARIAQEHGHTEVSEPHIEKAALDIFTHYLDELDDGIKTVDPEVTPGVLDFFTGRTNIEAIKTKENRARLREAIIAEQALLEQRLGGIPRQRGEGIFMSPALTDKLNDLVRTIIMVHGSDAAVVTPTTFLDTTFSLSQDRQGNGFRKFMMKLSDAVMLDSRGSAKKAPLDPYAASASRVLRTLELGTNMFILPEGNADPMYFIDTLEREVAQAGDSAYAPQLTVCNNTATQDYVVNKARMLAKESDKEHVLVVNLDRMLINSAEVAQTESGEQVARTGFSPEFVELIQKKPRNIRFVFVTGKNTYFSNMSSSPLYKNLFGHYGSTVPPVLSPEQTKQAFRTQPALMNGIKTVFTPHAREAIIDECAALEGDYPGKALRLIKMLDSFYEARGVTEVSEEDAMRYIGELRPHLRKSDEGSAIKVIFETTKLDAMKGKNATRKEAQAFVDRIQRGHLGTTGAIIYSQDGSVGSGRKFTARAIAGETSSPYAEINALDFGTKEVNIFAGETVSPIDSMKKLFAMLRAQAESHPQKAAVLFVENFEYFSVGAEIGSEHHHQAMAQLLREMDRASADGFNILVLGSIRNPDLMGESITKSLKFADRIVVESPARNLEARTEILEHFIKRSGLELAGATPAEKQKLVTLMAETTDGQPFISLRSLVQKVRDVSEERGHSKGATRSDIIEAYLQQITGRPASQSIEAHEKQITTSHECGHAFSLEYMQRLAERQGRPWHLGPNVNFITLDPRGWFGGAVFSKNGKNHNITPERIFTELVWSFGGHSAEKRFFGIQGSWGITADIEGATRNAQIAIGLMGQGHHFGVKSVAGMPLGIPDSSKKALALDMDVLLENARLVSDLITGFGADFNREFTARYADRVGTGECLIHGNTFRAEMDAWIGKLSRTQRLEMQALDRTILAIIEATKRGQRFGLNKGTATATARVLGKRAVGRIGRSLRAFV